MDAMALLPGFPGNAYTISAAFPEINIFLEVPLEARREAKKGAEEDLRRLPDRGVYQLLVRLGEPAVVEVGALGELCFEAGYWVYTGSARRGLRARVRRHLSRRKKLHWHIDYLLEQACVVGVRAFREGQIGECAAHRALAARFREGPAGFGSSDCRCLSHLVYAGEKGLNLPAFLPILHRRRHAPGSNVP